MRPASRFLWPLLLCASLANSLAQAPAKNPAGDQNAPEMTSHDTAPTFQTKVNLVLVPVVVRDRQGEAVGNLRQEDFQLFDKGKPQIISKFSIEKSDRSMLKTEKPATGSETTQPNAVAAAMPERYVIYPFLRAWT